jgi:hypothetical protein
VAASAGVAAIAVIAASAVVVFPGFSFLLFLRGGFQAEEVGMAMGGILAEVSEKLRVAMKGKCC